MQLAGDLGLREQVQRISFQPEGLDTQLKPEAQLPPGAAQVA